MEFISAEEFLKQDKKVQEVFIDWWKPSVGDLYAWNYSDESENDLHKLQACTSELITELTNDNKGINGGDRIPLLTEGQLRRFIEDKTNSFIENINFRCFYWFKMSNGRKYDTLEKELLPAYWQVAIQVAKEEIFKGALGING